MQISLASHLISTYNLIKSAFPNGIDSESYYPLLALLYEEMSDRNLAEVISHYTGKNYAVVFNDIYKVISTEIPDSNLLDKVKQHLLVYGYQDWLVELK